MLIDNLFRHSKPKAKSEERRLWPSKKGSPRLAYETDAAFHDLYDRGLSVTAMEDDNPRRRLRYYTLAYLVRSIANIPGDLCEIGCYRGLSAYLTASLVRETRKEATFHICDSFEGLSEFAEDDRSAVKNMDTPEQRQKYVCSLETVQSNLREFEFLQFHKGWVPEPFDALADKTFCYVHIDVDLYQPTRDCFGFFYPRLSRGGVMVFDDYGSLSFPGAKKAIDESLAVVDDAAFVAMPSGQAFLFRR